ncbi:DUF3299 domain-containing protein [Halopseudomonas pelagia]|uniref:DUF3299 domain-containing protein n=1 Tax=Halopseudomonas pelagia TaxID=553151 RepID=A0AA91U4Y2_9GAMM|nr:DUF3299 domain-containing protein [Halopseudomonas pelagia]PCD00590.1 hypothetical protein CO192_05235 [Halopseudomonas pelagia]QFY55292.1 DUF3299 domain-containing protein [Halopseudomonas pelagia]
MRLLYLVCLCLVLSATAHAAPRTVDWLDLLPEEDYQAMLEMPEIGHDGKTEAPGDFTQSMRQRDDLPAVMYSTRVVESFDKQQVKIAGFPVPLETNENGDYTSFFLVPYAGACIHVPPPPPNQIILVDYPQGIAIDDIYEAFWMSGTLHIELTSNALADASYRVDADQVWVYDGE